MKEKVVGFFQEVLPNGQITRSTLRMAFIGLIAAAILVVLYQVEREEAYITDIMNMLKNKTLTNDGATVALINSVKSMNWEIVGILLGAAFGGKIWQKNIESTNMDLKPPHENP